MSKFSSLPNQEETVSKKSVIIVMIIQGQLMYLFVAYFHKFCNLIGLGSGRPC